MKKPEIIIVDDNEAFLQLFAATVDSDKFKVKPFTSAVQALNDLAHNNHVDVIISDVQMPGMTGTEFFNKTQDLFPEIPFILFTAFGSTEDAIKAVKQGAFHYFEKPIDDKLDLFWATVDKAIEEKKMRAEIALLRKEQSLKFASPVSIIGCSDGIRSVFESINEISDIDVTVLIQGETGTGKELVAHAIHNSSQRQFNPFFAISCNEFAPGVLESELFGHEKGAFTGAIAQKKGLFEIADNGTIFLDEISDAPMPFQSKLLRVLETRDFTRVGGTTSIFSNFRIVAATNCSLEKKVDGGLFRQDLYYRLNVYSIEIPPLRKRRDDIPLIAEYYTKRFSKRYNKSINGLSETAMLSLCSYDWPGNVRELVNVIQRAVITCRGHLITTINLPFGPTKQQDISDLNLRGMEKLYIELALKRVEHNKTQAAKLLGINRKTLVDKMRKYEVSEE